MNAELEQKCLDILKQYWGYDSFRGIQTDIIESILSGRDTLGLMPTGGGKSICFQVPTLLTDGLCIVVTPLISLMKDQVQQLRDRSIMAETIYSGMMRDDIIRILDNCVLGAYDFLYISPERLSSELFQAKLQRMKHVSMVVVDEAHCISQWGYDFRPSYLEVAKVRRILPQGVPILALTATATPRVIEDIQKQLEFREKNVFSMSFERKNLIYVVRQTINKAEEMLRILRGVPQGSAIVYVRSRSMTVDVARFLSDHGITAENYHAGLTAAEKNIRQGRWTKGQARVMVATNAFGMGIDKADVRVVIHYSMPDSIEAYFQEAGRAGRDGKTSYAALLYNPDDLPVLRRRVQENFPTEEYIRQTYENVCCFLEVGEGEALGRTFYFPLDTFCRTFHQFPVQASSALSLLNNAKYIEYHEEREFKSALHIIVGKEYLYHITDMVPECDKVMQAILRTYTGVFAGFVYIEETLLAQQTGMTAKEVYEALKTLHHRRVIDFIPHRKTPTITFTMPRVDTSMVHMPKEVYDDRRDDLDQRISHIIKYVSSSDQCRSLMMMRYFGDTSAGECGQCDVCLARKHGTRPFKGDMAAVRQEIESYLADGQPHLLRELASDIGGSREAFDEVISQMVDEELVTTKGAKIMLAR